MTPALIASDPRGDETAAAHLVARVPLAHSDETVASAVAALVAGRFEHADTLYVVDAERSLLGTVPLADLFQANRSHRLAQVMKASPGAVHPWTDQEHVATWALKHDVAAVPVVDAHRRFLGVVPSLTLLHVLRHEHVEDIHRLAGIRRETRHARAALEAPPARRSRDRLPWLLAGLVGSTFSALLMAHFESVLQARIAVAFFIPGIVYLADAIGTQTEAIAVRGLSLTDLPLKRLLWGELKTGFLIGGTLGVLTFLGVLVGLRDWRLALVVAATVLAAGMTATSLGIGLPALLARLGKDPAFGSGPVATIIQDVVTLLIYFAAVSFAL